MPYSPISVRVRSFFKSLWSGNFGLGRTYWYYGVVVNVGFSLLVFLVQGLFGDLTALPLALLALGYNVISSVGIWRAAGQYNGRKVFSVLARIAVVAGWLYVLRSFLVELQFFAVGY